MGYYPFGSKLFTDLLHYVRSGDFIVNLLHESQDLNEYAFALGALAHYAADNDGHRMATNLSVPMLYPKLRAKFGNQVTYADDSLSHIKTEFGYDVIQVAQGHYAPDAYHQFIGFNVAQPALDRAFRDTYALGLGDVFPSVSLSIGSYRHSVSSLIPAMTKVAWQMKKDDIVKGSPGITKRKFLYNLSRASYQKNWGAEYQKPGFGSRLLAFFFEIVPHVGPFRALQFKAPTPEVEKLFMASFNATLDRYKELLREVQEDRLSLPNENFDVGSPLQPGSYRLGDQAYAELLDKLHGHYADTPPELRGAILSFYRDLNAPISTKTNPKEWAKVIQEIDELKAADSPTPAVSSIKPSGL